jgi:hypothetical protein
VFPEAGIDWLIKEIDTLPDRTQDPTGYISIKDGTERFYDKADGFQMAIEYLKRKDVYKG